MLESMKTEKLDYQKLSPEEMKSRGILGRLVGVIADTKNPTRNGRLYTESLWQKVFDDPITKEQIKNKLFCGELMHPADRTETDPTKIAVCMSELPKMNSKGQLCAVLDILNTPAGNILKTLCDYGSTLGISSRGTGDTEIDDDGNETVNPDTYECTAFDIVMLPAVETARLQYVTESLGGKTLKQALCESLNNEKDEAKKKVMKETLDNLHIDISEKALKKQMNESLHNDTLAMIDTIKDLVGDSTFYPALCIYDITGKTKPTENECANVYDILDHTDTIYDSDVREAVCQVVQFDESMRKASKKDAKVNEEVSTSSTKGQNSSSKSVDIKSESKGTESKDSNESVNEGSDEMIKNLQEALKDKLKLESKVQDLLEKLAVSNAKVDSLKTEVKRFKSSTAQLSTMAKGSKELSSEVSALKEELKVKENAKSLSDARIHKLIENNAQFRKDVKSLNETISSKDADIVKLNESLTKQKEEYEKKVNELNESIAKLKSDSSAQVEELQNKLTSSNKIKEDFKKAAYSIMNCYIESKAHLLGVTTNEIKNKLPQSYTVEDVNTVCESIKSMRLNIEKLPFRTNSKVKVKMTASKNEHLPTVFNDDDVDENLMRMAGLK